MSNSILGLSNSEAKIIILSTLLGEQSKVDYDKLAVKAGYKNGATASTIFRNARRKLVELQGTDANGTDGWAAPATECESATTETPQKAETPKKTPAKRKAAPRKKAAATDGDDAAPGDGTNGEEGTLKKRQRKALAKKKAPVKVEEEENDEETEETPANTDANTEANPKIENLTVKEEQLDREAMDKELGGEVDIDADFDGMEDASHNIVKDEPVDA